MQTHTNGASAPESADAAPMSHMNTHDDDFDTVGELLAARRAEKGVTLSDVEAATRVREDYLEAIEAMDPRRLPDGPYAAGFVRTYAAYVDLDPEACSRRFRDEMSPLVGRRPKKVSSAPRRPKLVLTPQLALGAATFVIAGLLVWFGFNFSPERAAPSVPPVPESLREWAQVDPGASLRTSLEPVEGPVVALLARVDAEIVVQDPHGEVMFEGVVPRGERFALPQYKGVTVSTLNAAAIEAFVSDRSVGRLGVAGLSAERWSADEARERLVAQVKAEEEEALRRAAEIEAQRLAAEQAEAARRERERLAAERATVTSVSETTLPPAAITSGPVFGPAFDPLAVESTVVESEGGND